MAPSYYANDRIVNTIVRITRSKLTAKREFRRIEPKEGTMKTYTLDSCNPELPWAYVSNGLVGLRVPRDPSQAGEVRLNGCYEPSSQHQSESIALIPYPLALSIAVDDRELMGHAEAFRSQRYDFSNGELTTDQSYRLPDGPLRVETLVVCLRTMPSVVLQRVRVTSTVAREVSVTFALRQAGARGVLRQQPVQLDGIDWTYEYRTAGEFSSAGIAMSSACTTQNATRRFDYALMNSTWVAGVEPDEPLELVQFVALVPSLLHGEPHWQALRLARAAAWRGFGELLSANRAAWAELWKGRIVLSGADERWQDILDAAFFYLISSAHAGMPCSVSPFGLSTSGYGGHVFWDTETFMFPFYLLVAPEIARAVLRYRSERLRAARNNASLAGFAGCMFPWESGVTGDEVTPVIAATSEEHHITLDVAVACLQYAHATDDRAFVENEIWEILESVCDWIVSRVVRTDRGYEIRNVVGIDESLENVDNNAYTNIAAKLVLRQAADLGDRAGLTADTVRWRSIAEDIFIPIDGESGRILKHDRYVYDGGPCVPETLAAFFPLMYEHPDAVVRDATFDYHLGLAETVLHFPMLSSLFGVWATRRGNREFALECFSKGIAEFVSEPFVGFSEWRGLNRPHFLTNPAGFLSACLLGLTGLNTASPDVEAWPTYPIVLPSTWERIEVKRIWLKGRSAKLTAVHGAAHATIERLG